MKLALQEIKDGLDLAFDLDGEQFKELLSVTSGELRGTDRGLSVRLRAELVIETVLIRGSLSTAVGFSCVRCAEELDREVIASIDAALAPAKSADAFEEEVELTPEDLDVSYYEGDVIDLTALVREALLLEVPAYPTCDLEPEACPHFQARAALLGPAEPAEEKPDVDPRWAALKKLRDTLPEKLD